MIPWNSCYFCCCQQRPIYIHKNSVQKNPSSKLSSHHRLFPSYHTTPTTFKHISSPNPLTWFQLLRPCSVALGPFRCPIQNDQFKMEGRPFSHQKWTPSEMGPAQPNRALQSFHFLNIPNTFACFAIIIVRQQFVPSSS